MPILSEDIRWPAGKIRCRRASTVLFENAYYVLTPPDDVPQEKLDVLVELLSYTRAHIVKVEPRCTMRLLELSVICLM